MFDLNAYISELEKKVITSYQTSVGIEEAEKLAGEFLGAQILIAQELRNTSLDAAMRKNGVKVVRGDALLRVLEETEKKPADSVLQALVDTDAKVVKEQEAYEQAKAGADYLQNFLSIFKDAHIFYRGIAKGKFE